MASKLYTLVQRHCCLVEQCSPWILCIMVHVFASLFKLLHFANDNTWTRERERERPHQNTQRSYWLPSVTDISVSEKRCFQTYLFTYLLIIILLNLMYFQMAVPIHWTHGDCHISRSDQGFCWTIFCVGKCIFLFYTIYTF